MQNSSYQSQLLDVSTWREERTGTAARRELPKELVSAGVRRLGVSAFFQGLCLLALLGGGLALSNHSGPWASHRAVITSSMLTLVCVNFFYAGMSRLFPHHPRELANWGFAYLLVQAIAYAVLRHSSAWEGFDAFRQWSPIALILVLYAALVPCRPTTMLLWGMACVGIDLIAMAARIERDGGMPMSIRLVLAMTPIFGAAAATLCSDLLHGLSERIALATEVGAYRLETMLGRGGMGEVWSARHGMLAREAAVKLIRPKTLAAHGEEEARRLVKLFIREAKATAGLVSPHTIQIYDFGTAKDGSFYYVMELLHGYDLQTLVEEFGAQPPARVIEVAKQICHSLREAHQIGLVHRDLKPANIFLCRYGADFDFVKVLDFGLVMDRRPTEEQIEQPGMVGTPAVMAPEMMRFNAPVDQRADLYAVGCVLFWMLTGRRVFEADNRADMLVMHSHQKAQAPSKFCEAPIPEELEAIILQCLDKNPERRPQSAWEIHERLEQIVVEPSWDERRKESWWLARKSKLPEPI